MRPTPAYAALAALVVFLPFEPMEPVTHLRALGLGLSLSFLELVAGVLLALSALGVALDPAARRSLFRSPLAGGALAVAGAFFLSAALAEPPRALPLKFSLRVLAGVGAFLLASASLGSSWLTERRRCRVLLGAFVVAGGASATLAIAEALAPGALAPWLAPFREHPFEVGGRGRVTASFAYPNIAAGFWVLSLPSALFFVASRETSARLRFLLGAAALDMFLAILMTYSRGALLGAFAAAALFCVVLLARTRPGARDVAGLTLGFAALALGSIVLDPTFRFRASTESDESWYRARIEPAETALSLEPGALVTTRVRVANEGRLRWKSSGPRPFHLSYRWFVPEGERGLAPLPLEGERTPLAEPLAPGDAVSLAAAVRAPPEPGSYLLIWDVVHEHTTWFSDKVGLGTPVPVRVRRRGSAEDDDVKLPHALALRAEIATRAWRPGRWELWGLALRLYGSRPLVGVGPDNFRWLYGAAAGRPSWDRRTNANSLYLELLATTGLVGSAAFFGLVGGAWLRLRKTYRGGGGPRSDSQLAALAVSAALVGFLVHGIFDSLLAFTPIYLAFWIVLGIGSALAQKPEVST